MTKKEFFKLIKDNLKAFNKQEVENIIEYYDELINDKMESGLSEASAINSLGSVSDITNSVKTELVLERSSQKKESSLKNFLIILGIGSAPVLLPIMFAFIVIYFALLIVLLSLLLAFSLSSIGILISLIIKGILILVAGGKLYAFFVSLGAGFIGCAIFLILTYLLFKLAKIALHGTNKFFAKLLKKKQQKEVTENV